MLIINIPILGKSPQGVRMLHMLLVSRGHPHLLTSVLCPRWRHLCEYILPLLCALCPTFRINLFMPTGWIPPLQAGHFLSLTRWDKLPRSVATVVSPQLLFAAVFFVQSGEERRVVGLAESWSSQWSLWWSWAPKWAVAGSLHTSVCCSLDSFLLLIV